ncbi:MAPEG family protein [Undibacterium sp. RuTC16W]|uniref:MAPEG family protein n=1 Tax=Undibacterium sp. RuTC16W TaxID=3413048 RepID=UPI003BF2076C
MKTELFYLALVTTFTGLLWVPYILNRVIAGGLSNSVAYPEHPKPQAAWAQRLMKAHANAIENLVVFAPLVLIAQFAGVNSAAIATACVVYFWARVVHAVTYTFAIPWIRTLAFLTGVAAQMTIAWQLLMR